VLTLALVADRPSAIPTAPVRVPQRCVAAIVLIARRVTLRTSDRRVGDVDVARPVHRHPNGCEVGARRRPAVRYPHKFRLPGALCAIAAIVLMPRRRDLAHF